MHERLTRMLKTLAASCALAACAAVALPASAQVGIGINIGRNPPPPMRYEVPPPAPGPDYVWQDGYWNWGGNRYVWMPGRYDRRPYAGAYWSHPHYDHYADGWHMHEGHWDREDHGDHHDWNRDRGGDRGRDRGDDRDRR